MPGAAPRVPTMYAAGAASAASAAPPKQASSTIERAVPASIRANAAGPAAASVG
jgi:hypothetical protein